MDNLTRMKERIRPYSKSNPVYLPNFHWRMLPKQSSPLHI